MAYYANVREDGCILDWYSSLPFGGKKQNETDILFKNTDEYQLVIDGVYNPACINMMGVPLYKLDNGAIIKRQEAEIVDEQGQKLAEMANIGPSTDDRLSAVEDVIKALILS